MAQLYRFYVTNGEDSQIVSLVWANSDSEAYDKGFDEMSRAKYNKLCYDWAMDDERMSVEAFFTTSCIMDEARGLVLVDGKDGTVTEALEELLWDYLTEMNPSGAESARGDKMRQLRDEILADDRR